MSASPAFTAVPALSRMTSPQPPGCGPSRLVAAETLARRRRLEADLLRPDLNGLDDFDCLEVLCGLDEAAARVLLDAFGSLPEVLGAPPASLVRVTGRRAAGRIKLAQELARRLLARPLRDRCLLTASSQVQAYLRATLVGAPREQFRVLFLDKRNRLIADERMSDGTVDHAPVYPREVVRRALELNASAMLLCHNHPTGDPTPSAVDIDMTRQVVAAAEALGLQVHDHLVVGGQQVASLRALGLM
ncbi:RadC family protein [Phenylobacterium sp.]|uniref:JAB domain-containing protein n=1 Tax=Phenylobacterium sp. TaxID=1871053 RepID=UPI00356AEB51